MMRLDQENEQAPQDGLRAVDEAQADQAPDLMDVADEILEGQPEKSPVLEWLVERGARQLQLAQDGMVAMEAKLDRLGTLGASLLAATIALLGLVAPQHAFPWWIALFGLAGAVCFGVSTYLGLAGNLPHPLREIGSAERWAMEYVPWASTTRVRLELLAEMSARRRQQSEDNKQLGKRCRAAFKALATGLALALIAVALAILLGPAP